MDIENMHPFCLPFGLCHDATSSSITADFGHMHNSNNENTSNCSNNNNNNMDKIRSMASSPSDELFRHLNQATSSLSSQSALLQDELIINSSTSLDIIRDDSFYSLEFDINIDVDNSSLENETDIDFLSNDELGDVCGNGLDFKTATITLANNQDDWYCNQFSLFSPPISNHHQQQNQLENQLTTRRKSLIRTALFNGTTVTNNNQVFHQHLNHHHIVDPIDIKSSPTLAQLNLNSNDDPTDGLWGDNSIHTTNGGVEIVSVSRVDSSVARKMSSTSTSSSLTSNSSSNLDLLSNCTSINAPNSSIHHHNSHHLHTHHNHHQRNNIINSRNSLNTCNHFHHQYSVGGATPTLLVPTCHSNQHSSVGFNAAGSDITSSAEGSIDGCQITCDHAAHCTCPVTTNPFEKPDTQHHQHYCFHHHQPTTCVAKQAATSKPNLSTNQSLNIDPSGANLNHLNLVQDTNAINLMSRPMRSQQQPLVAGSKLVADGFENLLQQSPQQRSTSPALVTSSSSPLSSSAVAPASAATPTSVATSVTTSPPAQPTANAPETELKTIDNKLKENIEYLTQLLCSGNKLEQNIQQPSISSTMTRSYATLAQSLSTGPKLLERHHLACSSVQQPAIATTQKSSNPTSEADISSHIPTNRVQPTNVQIPSTGNALKRPYQATQQEPWFNNKMAQVESSVSAADSTEIQVTSLSTNLTNSTDKLGLPRASLHSQVGANQQQTIDNLRPKSSELKVLSSLLNGPNNNAAQQQKQHQQCNSSATNKSTTMTSATIGAGWQPMTGQLCSSVSPSLGHHQQQQLPCGRQQQQTIEPGQTQLHQLLQQQQPQQQYHPPAIQCTSHEQQSFAHLSKHQVVTNSNADANSSVPVNGKPITLTPIANNNSIIINQQPMQKPRVPLFAQPASPSTSLVAATTQSNTETATLITAAPTITTTSATSSTLSCAATASSVAAGQVKRPRNYNQKAQSQALTATSATAASLNAKTSGRSARPNSMSTDCSLSSHDEGFSSLTGDNEDANSTSRDSDDEDDVDSDDESFYGDYTNNDLIGASISDNAENKWTLNMGRTRRNGQKRYFWQYNVQSKGPKGTRISSTDDSEDPFVLPEASDPVFSNDCQVEGVKHSGKARRGDGNDLTPNPRKLLMIGLELKKLGKIINDLAPVTELPVNARNKTRKEKNKLASRACRLKKKAQHEANKIKLYGLQREHQQIVLAIYDIRKLLNGALLERDSKDLLLAVDNNKPQRQQQSTSTDNRQLPAASNGDNKADGSSNVNSSVETIAEQCSMKVAGQTSDYVNSVLEKVVSGCIDGGLQT